MMAGDCEAKRMGRPARAGVRATKRLEIRVTLEEYELWAAAAALTETTIADYVRTAAVGAADEDVEERRGGQDRRRVQVDIAVERRSGQDRRR